MIDPKTVPHFTLNSGAEFLWRHELFVSAARAN